MEEEQINSNKWHVGKEIPIAVLLMLALQTGGGIWWAASLSQKLDYAITSIEEIKRERYTKDDAQRDLTNMRERDADIMRRIAELERYHRADPTARR